METVSITDFKQNIGTYFDTLIAQPRSPLLLQRRKHSALIISTAGLSSADLRQIQQIRAKKADCIEVQDKDWVRTFNTIAGTKKESFTL